MRCRLPTRRPGDRPEHDLCHHVRATGACCVCSQSGHVPGMCLRRHCAGALYAATPHRVCLSRCLVHRRAQPLGTLAHHRPAHTRHTVSVATGPCAPPAKCMHVARRGAHQESRSDQHGDIEPTCHGLYHVAVIAWPARTEAPAISALLWQGSTESCSFLCCNTVLQPCAIC